MNAAVVTAGTLAELESVIERGMQTFVEVGAALESKVVHDQHCSEAA